MPEQMPRCETCKHFIDSHVIDLLICDRPELAPDPEAGYQFEPPSPDFGCTLHERSIESGQTVAEAIEVGDDLDEFN